MINPESKLFCRLDGLAVSTREQQRILAMAELGLLEPESVPVFEEATQTAAHFLDVPICILALMEPDKQRFKSAIGLSRLGLMNELATTRQFPRTESFCTQVVDSQQVFAINDTLNHVAFANSTLTQQYGIRAYLGVPLLSSTGHCLGTLAVMDLAPREFTIREIEFLELTARWSMSEYERKQAAKESQETQLTPPPKRNTTNQSVASQLKVELLGQLAQELRTPLTSVMGMASVLNREIYGPLTGKQKEYLDIIHHSGQYLLSLVNEILELSSLKDSTQEVNLSSVDVEMLCQQAINTLEQAAHRREQQIRLSVEPGRRIWLLDKEKVRQMLYHLVFSVIQSSTAGSIVRLHVSRKGNHLNLAVWVSHPWLGEGLPYSEVYSSSFLPDTSELEGTDLKSSSLTAVMLDDWADNSFKSRSGALTDKEWGEREVTPLNPENSVANSLGMLLCRQLAEMHGGQLMIQGEPTSGYRYVITLPQSLEAPAK